MPGFVLAYPVMHNNIIILVVVMCSYTYMPIAVSLFEGNGHFFEPPASSIL
jgi:hypothetical protein